MIRASTAPTAPTKRPRTDAPRPSKLVGSPEAKLRACVVLEVLGGLRTPADAAAAIGVTLPRYYQVETRALQGLLAALDVQAKRGPRPSVEGELARTKAERDRLEREVRRAQALVRATQRAIGLAPPKPPRDEPGKRKKKRPTVRARRLAEALRAESVAAAPTVVATGAGGAP